MRGRPKHSEMRKHRGPFRVYLAARPIHGTQVTASCEAISLVTVGPCRFALARASRKGVKACSVCSEVSPRSLVLTP